MRSLLLLLPVMACAACSVQRATLRPSQVNVSLHDLDPDAQNPFNRDPSRVQYVQVGSAEYDGFFKDAAQVNGTIILSNVILGESNDYLAKTKSDLAAGNAKVDAASAATARVTQGQGVLTPDQRAGLSARADRLHVLSQMVGALPGRSVALAASGKRLAAGAKDRFSGVGALKLPVITQGLDDSIRQLQNAGDQAPTLAAQLDQAQHTLLAMVDDKPSADALAAGPLPEAHAKSLSRSKRKKAAAASKKKKPSDG